MKTNQKLTDSVKCQLYLEIAYNSTNPDKRIFYARTAYNLAIRNDINSLVAASLKYEGDGLILKGNLSEAIEVYIASGIEYEKIRKNLGVAVVYSDIGDIYASQNNFKNSSYYYKKGINILRIENDSIRLATALLNVGELYREHQKLDTAITYFQESSEIFQNVNHQIGSVYNLGNMGLVYEEQGEYILAEEKLKEAIVMLTEFGDYYPIASYEIALSRIYEKRHDLKEAMRYAQSAYDISIREGLKEQTRDASLQLSNLYKRTKNFEMAFDFQSQYIAYRDSINNDEVIRKMADLRTEYEVGQKQVEVDLKQVEVDLLYNQSRTERIILIAALIGLVLVFILAYVLFKLYRLRERAIRISKERRRIIASQRNNLEALNITKDKFFSLISHDIRGPVNNFHGVAQLIKIYVEAGEVHELIRVSKLLDKSTTELSTLLDNLLDWAMSQQGKFPYKPVKLSLESVCNSNLIMMQNMASAKGISMTEEIFSDVQVFADRNSVTTIIRNLLSNALKFTEQEGEITLTISQNETEAIVTISDTGIGIPRAKMEGLFGFKGERSRWGTAGEKGVGLGLNLVNEFIILNHGRIEVESDEGVGSDFRIYLPLFKGE